MVRPRILPFALLLLSLSTPVRGGEGTPPLPEALRIVPLPPAGADRATLFRSFAVLEDLGDFLVTEVRPGDPAAIEGTPLPARTVRVPAAAQGIFVVSLLGLPPGALEERGWVLHRGAAAALLAAKSPSPAPLERPAAHPGLPRGIRPMNLTPLPPLPRFAPPSGWRPGKRAADPRIQAMVDQVDENNLKAVVQDLQDMGERRADSGAFAAEAYLPIFLRNSFPIVAGVNALVIGISNS